MNFSFTGTDSFFSPSDSDLLLTLIWILPLFVFVMYGQRIQLAVTSRELKKSIANLLKMREESRAELARFAGKVSGKGGSEQVAALADYFAVLPISMDPAGLVPKVRHLVRSKEDLMRSKAAGLLPKASEGQISQVLTMVELAAALQAVHKAVNHMFLTAKKQNNYPLILPLQMVLPTMMEEARAMRDALPVFGRGQPVGDGIGPLVAARMMDGLERTEASGDTDMCRTRIAGRDVTIIKARGPMSTVGRMSDALDFATSKYGKHDALITIDAAKKLEGEESGEVARGFGVAMGGIGVDRFEIEENATKHGMPTLAVVVRQTVKESMTLMTEEIASRAADVQKQVTDALQEAVPEGGSAVIMGVGNTSGVP